jgi:hypothetical protein
MSNLKWMSRALLILVATAVVSFAFDTDVVHAVSGAVTKIDNGAKTITVKTADGTEQVFHYTEKTTVLGAHDATKEAKAGAVDTYFKGRKGHTLSCATRRRVPTKPRAPSTISAKTR